MFRKEDLIIKRDGRVTSLSIKVETGQIICTAPTAMSDELILAFANKHRRAIQNRLDRQKQLRELEKTTEAFTAEQVQKMADDALKLIPELCRKYAAMMGVRYNKITIRNQKTKWGSCSSKGNLNFNCYLMCLTMPEIEYIVVHELTHLKHMDHSAAFWADVAKVLPDYDERRKSIRAKEAEIFARRREVY